MCCMKRMFEQSHPAFVSSDPIKSQDFCTTIIAILGHTIPTYGKRGPDSICLRHLRWAMTSKDLPINQFWHVVTNGNTIRETQGLSIEVGNFARSSRLRIMGMSAVIRKTYRVLPHAEHPLIGLSNLILYSRSPRAIFCNSVSRISTPSFQISMPQITTPLSLDKKGIPSMS
jgi:hypothetical protein